ncbi:hypothetical protein MUP77_08995 [Candidatus Bathyarchaeota archaeon]|nr:hypothetical protein [Candidatus Bathyarchaeota archaeon]
MPLEQGQIRQALIEAVDHGLLTLGESGREAVYFHLRNLASVKREDIPENLEVFQRGLERIFGAGSKMIETAIVRSLCQKLGIQFEEDKNRSFAERLECVLNVAGTRDELGNRGSFDASVAKV